MDLSKCLFEIPWVHQSMKQRRCFVGQAARGTPHRAPKPTLKAFPPRLEPQVLKNASFFGSESLAPGPNTSKSKIKRSRVWCWTSEFSCEPCTEPSKHELNHFPSTSKPSKRPRQTKGRASGLQLLVSHCPSLLDRPNPRNTHMSACQNGGLEDPPPNKK